VQQSCSSIDTNIVEQVKSRAAGRKSILVCLDSNHTQDHVHEELRAYAPLVTKDSYMLVLDTLIEELPHDSIGERPWGSGDNPLTAIINICKKMTVSRSIRIGIQSCRSHSQKKVF